MNNFRFDRHSYTTPTYCDVCAGVLWGPVKVQTSELIWFQISNFNYMFNCV